MHLTSIVVDVLQLGLTGLVFLLMYFGFRLLSQERGKRSPNAEVLKRGSLFVWQSILVAILVGAVEIGHRLIDRDERPGEQLSACRDEVASLNRVSTHSAQTTDTLRSAIRNTWTVCGRPGE
jgi:hypothetical protein